MPRAKAPRGPTEKQFQRQVVQLAHLLGWKVTHHRVSVGTRAGWLDLFLRRPPRALFVELKTLTGKLTEEQAETLADLLACGFDARLWRPTPECWKEIEEVLR